MAKKKSILVPALLTAGVIYLLTRDKKPVKPSTQAPPRYTQTVPELPATPATPDKTPLITQAIAGQL